MCIRSFPIHEKEKRKSDKRKGRVVSPPRNRDGGRRGGEGKETQEEKDEEGSSGLHRFLNLLDRMPEGMARRNRMGGRKRGCSSDPFRICPIENLSDVHGVSSSRYFYRGARFIPPFPFVFVPLFF